MRTVDAPPKIGASRDDVTMTHEGAASPLAPTSGTGMVSRRQSIILSMIVVALVSMSLLSRSYDTLASGSSGVTFAASSPAQPQPDSTVGPFVTTLMPAPTPEEPVPGYIFHAEMDSTPGYNDIKTLERVYENRGECAAACDAEERELRPCRGFVTVQIPNQGERVKCYFKTKPFYGVPNKLVNSYFRPQLYRKSSNLSIVYGVLSAKKYLDTRLMTAYATWLYDVESVIFLENAPDVREAFDKMKAQLASHKRLRSVRTSAVYLDEPQDGTVRSFNGAWKNLPIMASLAKSHPDMQWYGMVDDDSFIHQHNLNILLTTSYGYPSLQYYVGVVFIGGVNVHFMQGGAGIFYNNRAAKTFAASYDRCLKECLEWAGDIRLGCCARIAGVPLSGDSAFWSQTVFHSLVRDARPAHTPFPVSFHNMRNTEWVRDAYIALHDVGESESLCSEHLFKDTKTCDMRRQYAALDKKSVVVLNNDTTTFLAAPVTWDVLMKQFRVVWEKKYEDSLFKTPPLR